MMLGVQRARPSVVSLGDQLRDMDVPALLIVGDEDEACVEPSVFMQQRLPRAGLAILPFTGHTVNLEEPDLFNQLVLRFLHEVEAAGLSESRGSGKFSRGHG
jgi:pimeloyl-ACP methyl ester carboxylesterase